MKTEQLVDVTSDTRSDLEEEIQDERKQYYYMFNSINMGLREFANSIDAQSLMFPIGEMYAETIDPAPCGLFCNR